MATAKRISTIWIATMMEETAAWKIQIATAAMEQVVFAM